jgi:hypothetical protein
MEGLIILLFLALSVGIPGLWIWSLIRCVQNRYLNDSNRVIGIVLNAVLGIVCGFVYIFPPREPTPQR